jgi:membrane protein involved in colicin uptake
MRKGIGAVVWAALFCVMIAAPSFAADEQQGTTDKTEWQKKMDDFKKQREQKIEEMKKGQAASDAQAGQKQEGQKQIQGEKKQQQLEKKQKQEAQTQEKKEQQGINKGKEGTRNEPAP